MKEYFLVLLAVVSAVFAHGQIELSGTVNTAVGSLSVPEDSELDVHWDVVNAGNSTLTLRAKRNVLQEVAGSRNRFCWGPLCYEYNTNQSSSNPNLMITLGAGATESTFHGYYEHQGYAGETIIEYCFFDHYYPEIQACHTVHFCIDNACIVGAKSFTAPSGQLTEVGPNPVNARGVFSYSLQGSPASSEVVFYNLVGGVVKRIPLDEANGFVFIDAADFNNGIYFYSLELNGRAVSTKRLVISK